MLVYMFSGTWYNCTLYVIPNNPISITVVTGIVAHTRVRIYILEMNILNVDPRLPVFWITFTYIYIHNRDEKKLRFIM
jgi:hypothetical protein